MATANTSEIAHELQIFGIHGMQAFRYKGIMDMIATGNAKAAEARRQADWAGRGACGLDGNV